MNRPALPLFTHLVALASLLAVTTAHAAVFTVGPPGDTASCSHATIQAAIDAAASPGLDIIRLATGVYPAQRLVVDDTGDLAIEGGFLECATLVYLDFSTLDGQGANPTGPVIRHLGS
jgi:pectin methylesterase-like acyl-CoA thioesterase